MLQNLLEHIFVGQIFSGNEISSVVHASRVREEGHRLSEPEDESSNVRLSLGGLVRAAQLGDVPLDERLFAAEAGDGPDVRDGFDRKLFWKQLKNV